ncbi:hypothetical protein FVEN_g7172 [Fusarium venenatum]|uniref:Uncharacterized protein n=1 Tax=Fusarium venenatum TaxID=56646 RepID=A0A2L2TU04_9HYPO|nr:uncharacterized protein FVRRES_10048 [Fusarium venenatum]KAG8354824.1 hypothetical protein FVEN_g7172 [Fusarium venenatum]KAH6966684.1 hypothetical protein EDB82DRAFT_480985 [Fusarium venenatum]CEI69971.1 unnamed protein product [Fusarium venenatum]
MARMLLTSSQVQVIASCFVVVSCTVALFISGYIIQQRTVSQLRSAIKPRAETRPSPKVYLPEKFQVRTKELEDGRVIDIDTEADIEVRRQRLLVEIKESKPMVDIEGDATLQRNIEIIKHLQAKVVDKMSTPEGHVEAPVANHKPVSKAKRRKMIKQELQKSAQAEDGLYYQRRMW